MNARTHAQEGQLRHAARLLRISLRLTHTGALRQATAAAAAAAAQLDCAVHDSFAEVEATARGPTARL